MMDTIEVYVCVLYSQNLQIQTPKKFQTGGRAPGAPVLDPPLYMST